MSSIKKVILGFFLLLFITGCMKVIEIEGNKEISINESHTYKAVIVSTKFSDMDSYRWNVVSDNKDYTLTGEATSEVTFNASSVGTYTLKVIAKKNRKPFKATIEIVVTEPEIINGYVLPPEPDPVINNSTLLGIDSNNNGVRDDVERWIFLEMEIYNGYEKIEQVIAMQKAKAHQMALADPANKDDEVQVAINAAHDCWNWYDYSKQSHSFGSHGKFTKVLQDKSFNTKERLKTY